MQGRVVIALVSALLPNTLWAAQSTPFSTLTDKDTLSQLKDAYLELKSDPELSKLLEGSSNQLAISDQVSGNGINTVKFQQYYKGIEVVGGMALRHSTAFGSEISNLTSVFDLDVNPGLSRVEAVSLVKSVVGDRDVADPALKILPSEEEDGSARLVYWAKVAARGTESAREVVVDAHTGEVIANIPTRKQLAQIEVYEASDKCQTVEPFTGGPVSLDIDKCDHVIVASKDTGNADKSAKQAGDNSTNVLKYYLNRYKRDSFDDKGSSVISVVHVGSSFDNAFWDPENKFMGYGDGDGKTFVNFTAALDVAGHEMTHGVTSQTARFLGFAQSGALDEATADFFGTMIASESTGTPTWVMGKDIFVDAANSEGIRNLEDPTKLKAQYLDEDGNVQEKPYPANMKDLFRATTGCNDRTNDNCWVHVNSTIWSHAAYLVYQAIGREKAEDLYYTTLTQFLTSTSTFRKARTATLKACGQLYDAKTCAAVKGAFADVGL